jgi:hypothetical protein
VVKVQRRRGWKSRNPGLPCRQAFDTIERRHDKAVLREARRLRACRSFISYYKVLASTSATYPPNSGEMEHLRTMDVSSAKRSHSEIYESPPHNHRGAERPSLMRLASKTVEDDKGESYDGDNPVHGGHIQYGSVALPGRGPVRHTETSSSGRSSIAASTLSSGERYAVSVTCTCQCSKFVNDISISQQARHSKVAILF